MNDLSYLGMTIQKIIEGVIVHQSGYIEQMVEKFGTDPSSKVSSPMGSDFMTVCSEDEAVNKTKYLSLIMSLMFLARFARIDILMPVPFLATKSADPKQKDYHKGMRILSCVVNTRTRHLWFKSEQSWN